MNKEHFDFLKNNRACEPGLEWAKTQSDLYQLWNNCHRGDWLLWLANKLQVDKKKLMLCGALCAHTVVHLMEDRRSREAVRIAFLYARGKATEEELEKARIHAWIAAGWAAAAPPAVRAAVRAAARATDMSAAAAAMAAARAAADEKENQRKTAEIARKILTEEVFNKLSNL